MAGEVSASTELLLSVTVTDASNTSVSKQVGVFFRPPLVITTTSMSNAYQGAGYFFPLGAEGGSSPYNWTLAPGSNPLPATLSMDIRGNIVGNVMVAPGTYSFTVRVTDTPLYSRYPSYTATGQVSLTVLDLGVVLLHTLTPHSTPAGGPPFTLTVDGDYFTNNSVVRWNGSNLTTTYVSPQRLTASVPASLITNVQEAEITVFDPARGSSLASLFQVTSPGLAISGLAPSNAVAGGGSFAVTVLGTGFVPESQVRWNGTSLVTSFVSATELTATVTAALLTTPGAFNVTVSNPAPPGTSNASPFLVEFPVPAPTSLSPANQGAGGGAFVLTVTGTGFFPQSVVRWNGQALSSTFVSSTVLHANVGAARIATAGSAQIRVWNPGPGGGESSALTFVIKAPSAAPSPAITLLNPSETVAGGNSLTVAVQGTHFVEGSQVRWNGIALPTTFGSETALTAAVDASRIALAGSVQVTVTNPGPDGGTSNARVFTISEAGDPLVSLSVLGGVLPGQQNHVAVTLSHAVTSAVSGQLSLTFLPDSSLSGDPNDPAIQFSPGGRTVSFLVPVGRTTADFGRGILMLQTGTVAGRVTVTMTSLRSGNKDILPSPPPVQTLLVNQEAPRITGLRIINRTTTSFAVEVEGFTTPRDLTQATFQFTPKPGQTLTTPETVAALSEAARNWFQNPASFDFGSQFVYTKPFTFEGGVDSIASVSVTLSNTLGQSNKVSTSF